MGWGRGIRVMWLTNKFPEQIVKIVLLSQTSYMSEKVSICSMAFPPLVYWILPIKSVNVRKRNISASLIAVNNEKYQVWKNKYE